MYALQVKYCISRELNSYNNVMFSINMIVWRHNVSTVEL